MEIKKLGFELPYDSCTTCSMFTEGVQYRGLLKDVSWGDYDKFIEYIFITDKGTDYDKILGGKDGENLLNIFNELQLKNWFITSNTLCRPSTGKAPIIEDIKCCFNNVETVLQSIIKVNQIGGVKPPTIILLGRDVLRRFTDDKAILKAKVSDLIGQEFELEEYPACPIYVTYNPAAGMYDEKYFALLKTDLSVIRDKRENVSRDQGTYFKVDDINTFHSVMEYLSDATRLSYDIETTGKNYRTMLDIIEKKRKVNKKAVIERIESWRKDFIIGISFSSQIREGVYIPLWVRGRDFINSPHCTVEDNPGLEAIEDRQYYFWYGIKNQPIVLESIKQLLENPEIEKIAHNGKFDNQFLQVQFGIEVKNFKIDTMLLSYLANENTPNSLEYQSDIRYPDLTGYKQKVYSKLSKKKQADENYSDLDLSELSEYGCRDVDATLRLSYDLFEDIKNEREQTPGKWFNPEWLLENLYMPSSKIYQKAEIHGVKLDRPYAEDIAEKFIKDNIDTEAEFLKVFGREVNLNSGQQLQQLMYNELNWPVFKATGKDDRRTIRDNIPPDEGSTDQSTLKLLLEYFETHNRKNRFEGEINMIYSLLKYKKNKKLISTYLRGKSLFTRYDDEERIHTSYLLHGTKTGRYSSKPNLQNIPRGPQIRGMFVTSPGTVFLFADLSQAEMRLMGDYADDKVLIHMINNHIDTHWEGCQQLFYHGKTLTYDSKNPEMKRYRKLTKLCNFGRLYGAGTKKVVKSVNEKLEKGEEKLTVQIAEAHGEWFFSSFWRIKEYLKEVQDFILTNGYIENKFGRRRRLPDAFSKDEKKRAAALREGINAQIQGQASDIVQLAAVRIDKVLQEKGMKSQFLMSIHDELGYEVPEDEVDFMTELVPKEMVSKTDYPMNQITIDLESEVAIFKNRWNND